MAKKRTVKLAELKDRNTIPSDNRALQAGVGAMTIPSSTNLEPNQREANAPFPQFGGPNLPAQSPTEQVLAGNVRVQRESVGTSGTGIYGGYYQEDYLSNLHGTEAAKEYDKMRRSESQIAMLLQAVSGPIKSASWEVEPGLETDPEMVKHSDFIKKNFMDNDRFDFEKFKGEALTCIPFGYSLFEIVHNVTKSEDFGTYNGIESIAFRSQKTILRWHLERKTGRLLSVFQLAYGDVAYNVEIPGEFLLPITLQHEGDNYEGISALRPIYGAYKRKQLELKLLITGIEKYAYGVPIGTVPANKSEGPEFERFKAVLKNYMANQQGFITLPEGWKIEIDRGQFDAEKIVEAIKLENVEMINAFVANFLALGTNGKGGAFALSGDLSEFFFSVIQSYADLITGALNRKTIPDLIKMNFGPQKKYPTLKVRGINDKAGEELANAILKLCDSQAIRPDDKLEDHLRRIFKMPKADPSTARQVIAKGSLGTPSDGTQVSQDNPQSAKFSEQGMQFGKNKSAYKNIWDENKDAIKSVMQKSLRSMLDDAKDQVKKKLKASTPSTKFSAISGLDISTSDYKKDLRPVVSRTAAKAMAGARSEVPSKKSLKLSEKVDSIRLDDGFDPYSTLPPNLRKLIDSYLDVVTTTQANDLEKGVTFQFLSSAQSTDDEDIIAKDIESALGPAIEEGSTKAGMNVDTAAGDLTAQVTQAARNEFFFEPEVLDEIESFTFTNEDPVSEICQELAGTVFSADDPEAERYYPPLHHNCKSRITPNLRGDSNNPKVSGPLHPSPEALKAITLCEHHFERVNVFKVDAV